MQRVKGNKKPNQTHLRIEERNFTRDRNMVGRQYTQHIDINHKSFHNQYYQTLLADRTPAFPSSLTFSFYVPSYQGLIHLTRSEAEFRTIRVCTSNRYYCHSVNSSLVDIKGPSFERARDNQPSDGKI